MHCIFDIVILVGIHFVVIHCSVGLLSSAFWHHHLCHLLCLVEYRKRFEFMLVKAEVLLLLPIVAVVILT